MASASRNFDEYRLNAVVNRDPYFVIHTLSDERLPPELRRPGSVQRWEREKELGKGTFGTVWLEVLRSGKASGREVRAVKRIQKKLMRDKRELAAMTDFSRRKYLHIGSFVEFFGWFEDSANIYIAMEYFPYGTLSDYIGQGIPENEIRKITGQLLVGLALMHEHDYTHRDLKPDNIFIDTPGPEWSVKIGDFGVSKYVNRGMTALRTGTGTPLYEAPEIQGDVIQETEEEYVEYTNIVDMWSLSCVVFEMAARAVLFPRWPLDYKKLSGRLSAVEALKHEWITSRDPQPLTGEVVQDPGAAAPSPKKDSGLNRVGQSGSSGKVQAANGNDNDALTALSAKTPQVMSSSGEHGDGNLSGSSQRRTVIRRISQSNNRDNFSAGDTHQTEPAPPKAEPLRNKVTLRNPKAIVGSLSGAETDIDDEAFRLDLPFSIKVYGHSSSTLFIIKNGMICLDQAPSANAWFIGTNHQELPFREGLHPYCEGLPPYCLFPYWTYLLIKRGMPHGIYYEIEGSAPKRLLKIEYYVTRYHVMEYYFHFLVIIEEARPNIVTFRYYDVPDNGRMGTVGVQGPDKHKMFSFNQPKIRRGVQLVFNTTPNVNDVQVSEFQPY
ncbi:hypothetical protein IFM58399_00490 [Aspergillus lentulus]|uniref:serine/threonine-protein kinase n=1 Tax=Aspergillus lentulus TaxID=293939 RepID=UPI00139441E0|nr:uncharacterized protein IFM58399_00490 [Aspergillus lentulus]GFF23978.1 hypothetical protein IFM58399_00490 [Aspergillus lentulus]GFF89713.1 hypothetical protein IFM47457_08242 [Aspergillus lentulus]